MKRATPHDGAPGEAEFSRDRVASTEPEAFCAQGASSPPPASEVEPAEDHLEVEQKPPAETRGKNIMERLDVEILLMRHGQGIKPGYDLKKEVPGPDGVLTAAGYRDAQAVGHTLGETLTWSCPEVPQVTVCYALPSRGIPSPEPKATAVVVARLLRAASIDVKGPKQFGAKLPGETLDTSATRKEIRSFVDKLDPMVCNDSLVLVVANSPQIDWVARELLPRPVAIGRGEVIGIGKRSSPLWWARRKHRDFLWAIGPRQESEIEDLKSKIRSKMDTAKFLGTFITALLTFVLGKGFDTGIGTGFHAALWLITIVGLGLAALLCFAAVIFYDTLLMPIRFWGPSRLPWLWRPKLPQAAQRFVEHPSLYRQFAQRPPSSAAWVLYQNMVRVWTRLVVAAMVILAVALAAFAVLVTEKSASLPVLVWGVIIVVAIGAVASVYISFARPHLGAQD